MPETPPQSQITTQEALVQAQRRLVSLNKQLGQVQAENPPQVQQIANLQAAIVDAQNAINSIANNT